MPRHNDGVALRHMLDYARTAVRMVADRTIDLGILWDIVTLDLPPLIVQLEAILCDESEPGS